MALTSAVVALADLAAAQRHRHLLEALFAPTADPTLFAALDAGPPAFEATARPVALAAFAGATVAIPSNVVGITVCGVDFHFVVVKHNNNHDGASDPTGGPRFADSVAAVTLVLPTPTALWQRLRPALHAAAAEVASAAMMTASSAAELGATGSVMAAVAASVLESLVRPAVAPPVTVVAGRDPKARVAAAIDAVRWIQRETIDGQQKKEEKHQPSAAPVLVTRTVRLATIFALAERRGGVGDQAAAAWSRLRTALEEAVCGYPFIGSAETRRRTAAAAATDEATTTTTRLTAAVVVLEDAELLDGASATATVMQVRLVTASLRRWLLALRDPAAASPPFALIAVAATNDAGGTRLHSTLTSPGLCNAHVVVVVPKPVGTSTSPVSTPQLAPGPAAVPSSGVRGFSGLVGVGAVTAAVERALLQPLRLARDAPIEALGLRVPKGALITGPSGCGKTALLAALYRVLSNNDHHSGATMAGAARAVLVDAQSLIRKEVGASEKNVSRVFAEARAMSPCVLLIDGLDAIARPRGGAGGSEADSAGDRVLSTLLIEMDGIASSSPSSSTNGGGGDGSGGAGLTPAVGSQQQHQSKRATVVVVATATSAANLDAAVRRSGRLDVHLQLDRPDVAAALGIIEASFAAVFPPTDATEGSGVMMMTRAAQWGIRGGAWSSHADVVGFCREVAAEAVRTLTTTGKTKPQPSPGGDGEAVLAAAVAAAMERRLAM